MIFDQYQRYKTVQLIAKNLKEKYSIDRLSILELGANEQCNLEKMLPEELIQYSDITLSDEMINNGKFIVVDGRNMKQFEDNKYDMIIALDVLEHVKEEDRYVFLKEMQRVSKYLAVACFPFNSIEVCGAETRANNYYRAIYGQDHIWLKEHIDNVLPDLDSILRFLETEKYNYTVFQHGNIIVWEELIKALFASYKKEEYASLMDGIDELYEQKIYFHDIGESNYRTFIVLCKEKECNSYIQGTFLPVFDNTSNINNTEVLFRNIDDLKRLGSLPVEEKKYPDQLMGTIYYDRGNGYSEKDTEHIIAESIGNGKYRFTHRVDDLESVFALRYDPVEGQNCIITHESITQNGKELDIYYSSSIAGEHARILLGNDPMVMVNISDKQASVIIEIEFLIEGKEFIEESIWNLKDKKKECDSYQTEIKLLMQEVQASKAHILEQECFIKNYEKKLENKQEIIEKQSSELEDKKEIIEKQNSELEGQQKIIKEKDQETKNNDILLKEKYQEIQNYKDTIIELRKELESSRKSYEHITNTKSWKITAPLRKIFKSKKVIPQNAPVRFDEDAKGEFCYNIEKFNFDNSLLEIEGWIFNKNREKETDIYINIQNGEQILESYSVELTDRKDVRAIYNLNLNKTGFAIQIGAEEFKKLDVFLRCESGETRSKIYIGTIEDQNNTDIDCTPQIYYIEQDIYCNVRNLKYVQVNKKTVYPEQLYEAMIDIIVPVYNGYHYLKVLLKSAVNTRMNYRFIFINDKSSDDKIDVLISDFTEEHPNTVYIKNETNLGFVKSVNKGLQAAQNHVVLLNTDVEVPSMWLERLMFPIIENPKIATATPFTNCGTICSFPVFCEDNKIFAGQPVDFVDACFQKIRPQYKEMPTGVGFCMGMNYNVIQEIGLLDEETFGKGYGEENDWCQRAIKKGYTNVHVENLFVYHKHGGSFLSEEKKRLLDQNMKALLKKHPLYSRDVARYCRKDPARLIRQEVLFWCIKEVQAQSFLYLNHNLGGGATDYLQKKEKETLESGNKYVEIIYDIYENKYKLKCAYSIYSVMLYARTLDELLNELKDMQIDEIIVNELVSYPNLYLILNDIKIFKEEHRARMTMLLHDFFCICPTINLLDSDNKYCYLPEATKCEKFLKKNKNVYYKEFGSIRQWRSSWGNFLQNCNEVIAFSENSKEIITTAYPYLNNVKTIPHTIMYLPDLSMKKKHSRPLNIGLLGVLSERKGLSIIRQMADIIEKQKLDINIVLIGSSEETIRSKHFKQTGKYRREELPYLVCENDIDIFLIPSVWPETFSYTTEEIMKMGIPLAVFKLGAPMERVKRYEKGLLISEISADAALREIQEYIMPTVEGQLKKISDKKVLCIAEYISFSSRYRLEHLREEMLLQGIPSDFCALNKVNISKLNEYTEIVIYRCTDCHKIEKITNRAKKSGLKVYYDIDDYIFDFKSISHMEFLNDPEYKNYNVYCDKIYKCMDMCDEFITSTECLKAMIEKTFPSKKVLLNRNVASMEMLVLSESVHKKKHDKVALGYFSGSRTHNADFAVIEKVLIDVMEQYDNVNLIIAGCLELGHAFDALRGRITFFDFMDWRKLPEAIADVDINLMPLEDSVFHECKSENKWMEAALVHVPTICSYNRELAGVIEDGKTGVLCQNESDWIQQLRHLIEDKTYRILIADAAYNDVIRTHTTLANKQQI